MKSRPGTRERNCAAEGPLYKVPSISHRTEARLKRRSSNAVCDGSATAETEENGRVPVEPCGAEDGSLRRAQQAPKKVGAKDLAAGRQLDLGTMLQDESLGEAL